MALERVLLVASDFSTRGVTRYAADLANFYSSNGISTAVLAGPSTDKNDATSLFSTEVKLLKLKSLLAAENADYLKQEITPAPQLVYAVDFLSIRAAASVAKTFDIPYIATVHHFRKRGSLCDDTGGHPAKIIAVSESLRENLVNDLRVNKDSIEVILAGIDIEQFDSPEPPEEDHIPVVGSIGRLEKSRGHIYFLKAAKIVTDAGKRAFFLLSGAGPEEKRLRKKAADFGLADRITFAPYMNNYREILRGLDIFVLPSLEEGLGYIVLEAMAYAKPVVSTSVGGVMEALRDGETGLAVKKRDPAAMAEAIGRLVDDPVAARAIGRAARQRVARDFRLEDTHEKMLALSEEVIANI